MKKVSVKTVVATGIGAALFLVLFASLSIELTQLFIGRVFDVDDILLNVLGGIIGYLFYYILSKILM